MSGNSKEGLTTGYVHPAHTAQCQGALFPLCACVARSTAQLENDLVSISSGSQKMGKSTYMRHLMILLLLTASLHKPTLPLCQELTQRPR